MAEKRKRGYEENKKYAQRYMKANCVSVAIRLNKRTEADLIEIYKSIPEKAQWFKDCLRMYAAEHSR